MKERKMNTLETIMANAIDNYKNRADNLENSRNKYKAKCEKYEELINKVDDIRFEQGQNGTWNSDNYTLGTYNGLELALSILESREPRYREMKRKVGRPKKN